MFKFFIGMFVAILSFAYILMWISFFLNSNNDTFTIDIFKFLIANCFLLIFIGIIRHGYLEEKSNKSKV